MRLVQVKVRRESVDKLRAAYDMEIIPELAKVRGCKFATLVQSIHQPTECISLTLWENAEAVDEYVRKGTYTYLLEGVQSYLAYATEWKVKLSADQTMEYVPITEEPTVKAYQVAHLPETSPISVSPGALYVRILSMRIQPGKMSEFLETYISKILPVLRTTKGCRYSYLSESANDDDETISLTIWDSKETADEYEASGTFDLLVRNVKHLLSGLYQWKMSLGRGGSRTAVTSDDLSVQGYRVVTGRSFM